MKVAIIVGRFQAHYLHSGHQDLLMAAKEECDRVIIFIGTSIVRSERNPLPFTAVKQSVGSDFGGEDVYELRDQSTDEQWLENLYEKIAELTEMEDEIIYYGSRDSFLSTLPEGEKMVNIEDKYGVSATDLRNKIQYHNSRWFRSGYIKAVQDEFKAHYAVVDAIITDGENILLGRKKSGYCIIGGFADEEDADLEAAAIREVKEETGLSLSNPTYLMSHQCKDWRYRGARQPFSTVFVFKVDNFNGAVANDDISEVKVVPLSRIGDYLSSTDSHYMYIKKYIATR